MKLILLDQTTFPQKQPSRFDSTPRISFSKYGKVIFNPAAIQLMGLSAGSKISIAQDEDNPADWYCFIDEENGFVIKEKTTKSNNVVFFSHRRLIDTFLDSLSLNTSITHSFIIAGKPTTLGKTKYYCILTGSTN